MFVRRPRERDDRSLIRRIRQIDRNPYSSPLFSESPLSLALSRGESLLLLGC